MVVVVLPDPFRGMGAWRNSTETILHQRLAASTWWCGSRPSFERWVEMRDNYLEGSNHLVVPNLLKHIFLIVSVDKRNKGSNDDYY